MKRAVFEMVIESLEGSVLAEPWTVATGPDEAIRKTNKAIRRGQVKCRHVVGFGKPGKVDPKNSRIVVICKKGDIDYE